MNILHLEFLLTKNQKTASEILNALFTIIKYT